MNPISFISLTHFLKIFLSAFHFWKRVSPVFLFILSMNTWGCETSNQNEIPSPILATVNQDSITVREFTRHFRHQSLHPGSEKGSEAPMELVEALIEELIEHHLLLQEAHRQQRTVSDSELNEAVQSIKDDYSSEEFETLLQEGGITLLEWENQMREDLLVKKILSLNIDQKILISENEIRDYYEKHKKDFVMPGQVKARHIVTAQEEEAKKVRQALLQGESFEALAREKSVSPDREQGGDLGLFKKGEMPKEFDIVFSLKESAISPIVKTPYGFHLFQVEKKFPSRKLSFEEVQLQIQDLLFQIKREGLYEEWLQDLKSASSININLSVLNTKT